jgi:hypothetical protein
MLRLLRKNKVSILKKFVDISKLEPDMTLETDVIGE